jgi:hypothetical protein
MMTTPPPKAPAITAPTDPNLVVLKEVVVESGGQMYHIHAGVPCRLDGVRGVRSVISMPSRRLTLFVPCDGLGVIDQLEDEQWPAQALPTPAAKVKR